tara:strand:- start:548 stop:1168 length:621 start_codon:yes stop_codon:yes gene_type:complete
MNYRILPVIHKFNLRYIKPRKYPWGWRSQKEIRKILINTNNMKYQSSMFDNSIIEKTRINEDEFLLGSKEAYYKIHEHFYSKKDFLKTRYTTPELSLAINYISSNIDEIKYYKIQNLDSKILTSWIEVGNATSNNRLLGYWDCKYIKKQIRNSNLSSCWDIYVGPLKQKVKVLYKNNKRIDIWELERCIMEEDSEWTIANINDVLI